MTLPGVLDLPRLQAALAAALAQPELQADAARCAACIDLIVLPALGDAQRLTLWPGVEGGAAPGPRIQLQAPAAVWAEVFSALPRPGRQSLGALRRQCSDFALDAPALATAQALPFIERLLEGLRHQLHGPARPAAAANTGLQHLRGRYLQLAVPGADWVYTEQAGPDDAPALLMLHTAGADARQWHGLMTQPALFERWQLHAFDLPGHGRSPLPAGTPNWQWRLTEAAYVQWVLGYLDACGLQQVVLMGCSMGSAIGLALLALAPERFAGALLLETPYHSPGRRSPYLNHPEVHGGRLGAAWVGSLLSPSSPQVLRDRATWIYSQAAPGIYDGDLAFYSDDFDAHAHTALIDTTRTPLWLLTGDYDYSATPADSARVAQEVPGARFQALPGFGHFPMVENPDGLLHHLQAPLDALWQHHPETRP